MKIFWSWQSDLPGAISRHFIREALEEAITALNTSPDVQDAERPNQDQDAVELDHDRKGVPGSPDLAALILRKISQSQLFVADVTPVGAAPSGKKLMNPNVAIELGYALGAVGDERILLVFNTAYGDRSALPFDLAHKAGPIMYCLSADATKEQIRTEKKNLVGALKEAISTYLGTQKEPAQPGKPFPEMKPKKRVSSFLDEGDRLCRLVDRFESKATDIIWHDGPQMFLRVIPVAAGRKWTAAELLKLIDEVRLPPFGKFSGTWSSGNEFGAVTFEAKGGDQTTANRITQVSEYGEIWGIDGYTLSSRKVIPWLEGHFVTRLKQYDQFITQSLEIKCPLKIIAGVTGVLDYQADFPPLPAGRYYPFGSSGGCCRKQEVVVETTTSDLSKPLQTLLPFFREVLGTCELSRDNYDWLPTE